MRCLGASELMSLHLDSGLTRDEERALQGHLVICQSCQLEWEMMARACALLEDAREVSPPPLLAQRVMARIRRRDAWLGFLKGTGILFLPAVVVTLLALWGAPWLSVASGLVDMLGDPSISGSIAGAFVLLLNVLGTLMRAASIVVQAMFGGSGLVWLMGYVALVGVLALGWIRLVVGPLRVARRTRT